MASWLTNLLTGSWNEDIPIARCTSEATTTCACTTGRIDSRGHLVCDHADHGEYAGPNS